MNGCVRRQRIVLGRKVSSLVLAPHSVLVSLIHTTQPLMGDDATRGHGTTPRLLGSMHQSLCCLKGDGLPRDGSASRTQDGWLAMVIVDCGHGKG